MFALLMSTHMYIRMSVGSLDFGGNTVTPMVVVASLQPFPTGLWGNMYELKFKMAV